MFRVAASSVARRSLAQRASCRRGLPAVVNFHASLPFQANATKTELTETLEEPEPKKGLWDPMLSIPLGIAFAVPAIHYEWLLINEETQLAACFICFTMLVYQNFGNSIHDALAADGKKILKEHQEQEDEMIQQLQKQLDKIKMAENVVQDAKDVHELRKASYEKLTAAGKIKPQYDFKAQIEKLLGMMANEEAALVDKAKQNLMAEATADVKSKFASNKELQKSSLEMAIAQLEGKKSTSDPVQKAFVDFFKAKASDSAKVDEKAETAEIRKTIARKLNSVAMNEDFFFRLDETTGKPKMVA